MSPGEPTSADIIWEYRTDPAENFFSSLISGAQRQPNGNTLIADGVNGRVFEVNTEGATVWEVLLPPAAWVFRAERSDLSSFGFDLTGDLGFAGGLIWSASCADGAEAHSFAYDIADGPAMHEYIDQYSDGAQEQWATETCAALGGVLADE